MARCEGTTRSGSRCRLEAGPGSRFCHLHQDQENQEARVEDEAAEEHQGTGDFALEMEDLLSLVLAGVAAASMLFLIRAFGKWIPRL